MTGIITLNIAGTDTGNFNLYSNADVYSSAFAVNITRAQLLAGYVTDAIPNGTTIIRIRSIGVCQNSIDIIVPPQACYNFLPTDSYYLLDTISKSTYAYAYGPFDGYIENGIATTYKNLIKLNLDLTIDTSFDVGTGFDEILYTGSSILEQPDGKIIVTGTFTTYQGVTQNRIVRLNTDATVDATFITGTGFNNFTQSPAIDSNGSIIVTGIFNTYNGSSSPRIARLLSNGTIDPTFIIGSGFNNTTTDVLVNSDDSMFILGYFDSYNGTAVSPGITKLLPNGSIDPSFNAGTGITPYVPNNANYFARIPGETSFYVGGFLTDYDGTTISQIIKLNIDGTVDTSFNSGTGFDGVNLYSLAVVWGDKLIIEGDFLNYNGTPSNYAIILNADGSVYYTFDSTYMSPIIIGDNLFGAEFDDCLQLLHTFIPQFCNLEGTGIITVPPTTTTTTTIPLDCTIIGTGVITVSPTTTTTTTTTECVRPLGLINTSFARYYTSPLNTFDIFTSSILDACNYLNIARAESFAGASLWTPYVAFASFTVGETVYDSSAGITNCNLLPTGTYWAYGGDVNPNLFLYTITVVDGIITEIHSCPATTTTTTTTTIPCTGYLYNFTLFLCGTCTETGGGGGNSDTPLIIGKYYLHTPTGLTARIDSFVSCSSGGSDFIEDPKDTCAEVICPTTTTTTTINCLTCDDTTLIVNTGGVVLDDYDSGTDFTLAQTFTITGILKRVGVLLQRAGSPDYYYRAKVYSGVVSGASNPPANTLLGESNSIYAGDIVNISEFTYFCFDDISVSGVFTIVLEKELMVFINNSNKLSANANGSNPYAGGNVIRYYSGAWEAIPTIDLWFDLCYIP